jgi:hypothetical protein
MKKKFLFIILSIICIIPLGLAQEVISDTIKGVKASSVDPKQKKQMKLVKLKDGSFYTGYVLEDNPREILMDIDGLGKMYIPKFSIKNVEAYDPSKLEEGEIKEEKLTNRNYMFNRSALPFDEKKLTVDLPSLLFGQLSFAFNKNFRIGVFSSIIATPLGLNLGFSYPISKDLYLGGDINYGGIFFAPTDNYVPNIFNIKAKLTSGNIDKHLTVVAGYSVYSYKTASFMRSFGYDLVRANGAGVAFCGAYRSSRRIAVLGEINWQQVGNDNAIFLIDPAVRYHFGRKSSIVLGINMIVPIVSNRNSADLVTPIPLPHIGANFIID